MANLKDYYAILNIKPFAHATEIKKAYRKLAFKFHPDRNPDDKVAAIVFHEIVEAHNILNNERQRKLYDNERIAVYGNAVTRQEISPEAILSEVEKLKQIISKSDPFRINREALFYKLKQILREGNKPLVLAMKSHSFTEFINNIISCCKHLHFNQSAHICNLLLSEFSENEITNNSIREFLKKHERLQLWERGKIILAVAITLLICLLILLV